MSTLNNHLLSIHQEISIKDEDRQPYTKMFDKILEWFMKEMCMRNVAFRKMYKGTSLFGSVNKANEFDVFILLDLPFEHVVSTPQKRPGFVQISTRKCEKPKNDDSYKIFSNPLRRNKLQQWIEKIITKICKKPIMAGVYDVYDVKYSYKLCAIAHNIYVEELNGSKKTISINFVPVIKMIAKHMKRIVNEKCCLKDEYFDTFVAIPKQLLGCGSLAARRYTFQLVNPVAERNIIWDNQTLSVVYRLLKSLRDQYKLKRLKNSFLTVLFLWEVLKQPDDFLEKSISDIFLHMLEQLQLYFQQEDMPNYWVKRFNALEILKPTEIKKFAEILECAYVDLKRFDDLQDVEYSEVAAHFKTSENPVKLDI